MSILDIVQQQLGANGTQQIAEQIGADPATTQNAIQAAIPALLGGMAGAARQPGGADAITSAMGQASASGGIGGMLGGLLGGASGGGGGGIGGMLGGLLGGAGAGGIGGMLGGLLGGHQDAVQDGVQQASGLNSDQTKRLLMILAPIALAAIAHHRSQTAQAQPAGAPAAGVDQTDADGNGVPDVLEQQAREAQAQAPGHIGGLVGRILDMAQRPAR